MGHLSINQYYRLDRPPHVERPGPAGIRTWPGPAAAVRSPLVPGNLPPGHAAVLRGLAGKPEDALTQDVSLHLGGPSGSVRASSMPRCAVWAKLDHTF